MEGKSRNDILLEEKIDQIDDANFDKVYNINEMVDNSIDQFDNEIILGNFDENVSRNKQNDETFSLEVAPNEFLDNFKVGEEEIKIHKKSKIKNRPLIFAFTSIMALLGILFIYNMFVINSLEYRAGKAFATAGVLAGTEAENNVITFENGATMEIENSTEYKTENKSQTNWFDSLIGKVNQMFGGNY